MKNVATCGKLILFRDIFSGQVTHEPCQGTVVLVKKSNTINQKMYTYKCNVTEEYNWQDISGSLTWIVGTKKQRLDNAYKRQTIKNR